MNHLVEVPLPLFAAICVLASAGLAMAFTAGAELVGLRRRQSFDVDEQLTRLWDMKGASPGALTVFQRAGRLVRLERMKALPQVLRLEAGTLQESLDDYQHQLIVALQDAPGGDAYFAAQAVGDVNGHTLERAG